MANTRPDPASTPSHPIWVWLGRNQARLQTLILVLALGAPFGLYWALQSGWDGAATVFFGIMIASLAAVIATS